MLRLVAIVPFGLPHATRSDVIVDGYVIPSGTVVLTNLWSAGRDPRVWPEPDRFQPERFLRRTLDGATEIDRRLTRRFYPFGSGRRKCVGEKLGRTQILYSFAWIMRHFSLRIANDSAPRDPHPAVFGDVMKPAPYYIQVEPRIQLRVSAD